MRATSLLILLAATAAAGGAHASTLRLTLNHSARLPVAGPAASVVVGSPSVVDVSVVDSRTVFVSGKTAGSTDVTVIDPLGRVVYRGDIVVGEASTVRVFRGATRAEEACSPYCVSAAGSAAPTTPSGAGAQYGGAASPVGGLNAALAGGAGAVGASAPALSAPALITPR